MSRLFCILGGSFQNFTVKFQIILVLCVLWLSPSLEKEKILSRIKEAEELKNDQEWQF